jgi:hypothetical protein
MAKNAEICRQDGNHITFKVVTIQGILKQHFDLGRKPSREKLVAWVMRSDWNDFGRSLGASDLKPDEKSLLNAINKYENIDGGPVRFMWQKSLTFMKSDTTIDDLSSAKPDEFVACISKQYSQTGEDLLKSYSEALDAKTLARVNNNSFVSKRHIIPKHNTRAFRGFLQANMPEIHHMTTKDKNNNITAFNIDTRSIYLHRNSSSKWDKFASNGYPIEAACISSLNALFGGGHLRSDDSATSAGHALSDLIEESSTDTVISLGGGGKGNKDEIVADGFYSTGLFKPSNPLRYVLFDLSQSMLDLAVKKIRKQWRKSRTDFHRSVLFETFIGDMLKMKDLLAHLRYGHSESVCWFLSGGTFGNLPETEFLKSLNSVSHKGDILVLGVSVEGENGFRYEKQAGTNSFLRPELCELLQEDNLDHRRKQLTPMMSVEALADHILDNAQTSIEEGHSSVIECGTKVMRSNSVIDGISFKDIILHKHHIYNIQRLIDFMRGLSSYNLDQESLGACWDFKGMIELKEPVPYAQCVFLRQ